MIPKKYAPIAFGLILSGLMSLLVSAVATLRLASAGPGYFSLWIDAWLTGWAIAFPVVLMVAPLAQRFVRLLSQKG